MFSVVIPTLNRSDQLARAIASVGALNGPPPELIVVDDGSTADEAERIAALVAKMPGAKLVRQPLNMGAAAARNRGVAEASGEVIAFLDSDDWWDAEKLEAQRAAFVRDGVDVVYNSARVTRGDMPARGHVGRPKPAGWRFEVALAGWNFVGGCSLVSVRRSAFEAVGGFDTALPSCEDWDLWLKLAARGPFGFVDRKLGYYDAGPHQRLTTSLDKIRLGHDVLFARALDRRLDASEERYVRAVHHWVRAEIAFLFNNPGETTRELWLSTRTRPTALAAKTTARLILGTVARRNA